MDASISCTTPMSTTVRCELPWLTKSRLPLRRFKPVVDNRAVRGTFRHQPQTAGNGSISAHQMRIIGAASWPRFVDRAQVVLQEDTARLFCPFENQFIVVRAHGELLAKLLARNS